MMSGRGFAGFGWGKLLCFFFPKCWTELALNMSSFFVLRTGIVPSGHLPFWCHGWVIGLEFEETLLSPKGWPSGWKFGFICITKAYMIVWILKFKFEPNKGKRETKKHTRKVKFFTWILWFLRSGWSKAGWCETWIQSITSPSGLCSHNNTNAN